MVPPLYTNKLYVGVILLEIEFLEGKPKNRFMGLKIES